MNYREKAIQEKDEQCENCGAESNIEVHHRDTNRCNNDIDNLVVLCHDCHQTVHNGWPEKGSMLRDLKIDTGITLPEPVYREVVSKAEREDITRGAVVRDWMQKAEKYDEVAQR